MSWNISTDKIIAVGLVVALLLSIVCGLSSELQTNIAVGLIGYLGKAAHLDK
jgi:hypothetical protein